MFRRYRALPREVFIATLATVINNLGNVTAPFLTLILSAKLGFSLPLTALVLSVKTLLQMGGVALGGLASDRFGRKTVIRFGGYLATLTYFLMALFATRPMVVLVLLGVNSIAQATIDPALNALLMDIVPAEYQRDASAMKYFGLNLGFSIGPLLAAFLYKNSLPLLFLIDGVTLGIAVFLNEHYIREAYDAKQIRKSGFNVRDFWDNKALLSLSFAVVLVFIIFFQYNFGLPLALKDVLPQTGELLFGTLMSLNAVVVVLFTFLLNHAMQRMKIKSVLMLGMLFYAVGFGLYGFANGAMLFLIGTFIWSLGEIMVSTGVNPLIYELVEPSKRGRASAIFPLIRRVAAVISPLAGGWVLASFGFVGLWFSCALVMVLAIIVMKRGV